MSSKILVSLCVIRIEIVQSESEETTSTMATKKMRGRREPKNITVESYASVADTPSPLLPSSKSSISQKTNLATLPLPKPANEESSCSINPVVNSTIEGSTASAPIDQISFICGNPFVEVIKGILHLYKEDQLTEMSHAADRSHTICIIAVPATMTCHDLLTFTAACHENIQHFRILHDNTPNQYMALITMRSSEAAIQFYETFNGAPYNSLEPEVCHIVFVSRVEVADNGISLAGHTELPSCPVCLERMDESVDGILTILCNHTFHSSCLVKWGDISCPVCRYAQTPEPIADSHCMECVADTKNDALWICLICGHIGCSRYHYGHAFDHYRETHHCYAMQLGNNNRVWDYVGDNFVHRLLQDKDGKMVEGSYESNKAEGAAVDEKVDAVQLEFTYLLTSQLETQREYFEDRLNRIEQRSSTEITELHEKINQITDENSKMKEKLTNIAREKQSLEKKLNNSSSKLNQIQLDLTEEKEMRLSLEKNQVSWQSKYKQLKDEFTEYKTVKENELKDMKEQTRDLMFFLEAQKQIENSTNKEDIAGGTIIVPETSSKSTSRSWKNRKR